MNTPKLTITVHCLAGCGPLDTGTTNDPPRRPHGNRTRWAELDTLAEKHAKTHPTRVSAIPEPPTPNRTAH